MDLLDARLVGALKDTLGITALFPVQRAVLPAVLAGRDCLVRSTTGSGKTLAYALPLLHVLARSPRPPRPSAASADCRGLRAVVLAPTRDVALQVAGVFVPLCRCVALCVATAIGAGASDDSVAGAGDLRGADVLVATPGRLEALLGGALSLENVRFLVLDEADRVLSAHPRCVAAVMRAAHNTARGRVVSPADGACVALNVRACRVPHPLGAARDRLQSPLLFPFDAFDDGPDALPQPTLTALAPPLQRLLFSATLAESATKLLALHMTDPWRYDSSRGGSAEDAPAAKEEAEDDDDDENEEMAALREDGLEELSKTKRYVLPEGLTELLLVADGLDTWRWIGIAVDRLVRGTQSRAICFADSQNSVRSTASFLRSWAEANAEDLGVEKASAASLVAECSRAQSNAERTEALAKFASGEVRLLVATDLLARGIDLPHADAVINVDRPTHIQTYVHRAGRTARAGQSGTCCTIIDPRSLPAFRDMLSQAAGSNPQRLRISKKEFSQIMERVLPGYLAAKKLRSAKLGESGATQKRRRSQGNHSSGSKHHHSKRPKQ